MEVPVMKKFFKVNFILALVLLVASIFSFFILDYRDVKEAVDQGEVTWGNILNFSNKDWDGPSKGKKKVEAMKPYKDLVLESAYGKVSLVQGDSFQVIYPQGKARWSLKEEEGQLVIKRGRGSIRLVVPNLQEISVRGNLSGGAFNLEGQAKNLDLSLEGGLVNLESPQVFPINLNLQGGLANISLEGGDSRISLDLEGGLANVNDKAYNQGQVNLGRGDNLIQIQAQGGLVNLETDQDL